MHGVLLIASSGFVKKGWNSVVLLLNLSFFIMFVSKHILCSPVLEYLILKYFTQFFILVSVIVPVYH